MVEFDKFIHDEIIQKNQVPRQNQNKSNLYQRIKYKKLKALETYQDEKGAQKRGTIPVLLLTKASFFPGFAKMF
jgi:hypothetical protein